jgi:hypothetical protein
MATNKVRKKKISAKTRRKASSAAQKTRRNISSAAEETREKANQATGVSVRSRARDMMVSAATTAVSTARGTKEWVKEAGEYIADHTPREMYSDSKSAIEKVRSSRPIQRAKKLTEGIPDRLRNLRNRKSS